MKRVAKTVLDESVDLLIDTFIVFVLGLATFYGQAGAADEKLDAWLKTVEAALNFGSFGKSAAIVLIIMLVVWATKIVLGLVALGVAACADNRSSVHSDATTWERIKYQVEGAKEDVGQQQTQEVEENR